MNVPLKKPRLPRIERRPKVSSLALLTSGSEDSGHLWVISYADLLMVLLCFFVLFFTTGKEIKESIIHKILMTEGRGSSISESKSSTASGLGSGKSQSISLGGLVASLQSINATILQQNESLMIYLPEDVYDKGKFELSDSKKQVLRDIISRLKNYEKQIEITFIGHTDISPVSASKRQGITDNFDLSTARAKSALNSAVAAGFPLSQLKIEGDGAFKRASRTLTIAISPKGETK